MNTCITGTKMHKQRTRRGRRGLTRAGTRTERAPRARLSPVRRGDGMDLTHTSHFRLGRLTACALGSALGQLWRTCSSLVAPTELDINATGACAGCGLRKNSSALPRSERHLLRAGLHSLGWQDAASTPAAKARVPARADHSWRL